MREFCSKLLAYLLGAVVGAMIGLGILSAFSKLASAQELDFKYGIGVLLPTDSVSQVKHFSLEYVSNLSKNLKQKAGIGLWADPHSDRSSAGYGSYSIGVRVEPAIFYLESFWGVSLITNTDGRLSLPFNFTQDLGVGFQDSAGRLLGLNFKHFSNAGIKSPNKGRDFVTIQVGFPF